MPFAVLSIGEEEEDAAAAMGEGEGVGVGEDASAGTGVGVGEGTGGGDGAAGGVGLFAPLLSGAADARRTSCWGLVPPAQRTARRAVDAMQRQCAWASDGWGVGGRRVAGGVAGGGAGWEASRTWGAIGTLLASAG